jgi:tRNA A-37 threonylcarbamoyl transferase component Bud32
MAPAAKHSSESWLLPAIHGRWRFHLPRNDLAQALREELLALAEQAIAGKLGAPYHRSRQASTWRASVIGTVGLRLYVKLIEPPRGVARVKQIVKGTRGARLERITQALNDAGFSAPPLLLRATNQFGAEVIITLATEGHGPARVLADLANGPLASKWTTLRGIGRELARLHRCDFVHGDLTPFNLFLLRGEPVRLALIDNDRTRRTPWLMPQRAQLRNLVQLGRFALTGLSRTDKLRVMHGYSEMLNPSARRAMTRRASAMLKRRRRRDGGLTLVIAQPENQPPLSDARKDM